MKRGKQVLYNSIVPQSVTEAGEKGQRNTAMDDRRDAMAYRYYFHAIINRYRYDDCLIQLNKEFFLQPNSLVKELLHRNELISKLINSKTTTAELKHKYPYFSWISRL